MKKILMVGAGAYQVPAIIRAKELGYKVYCIDYKEGQPGFQFSDGYKIIDVKDKELCLCYAKELDIDGVLTWGATLTLPTVCFIGEHLNLPCISQFAAEISSNKFKIRRQLDDFGLFSGGETFQFCSFDDVDRTKLKIPFVIKPSDGSGSKGVNIVLSEKYIEEAIRNAFDNARNNEVYVEPYIDGDEFSVEAYVHNNEVYIYSIIKTEFQWVTDFPIYKQTTFLGISPTIENVIKEGIHKAVQALQMNWGPINFDIILSNGKPYIIDVGIRNGQNLIASHIVPYSRGVDELNNSLNLSVGNTITPNPLFKKYISSRLLIYKPGTIRKIKDVSTLIGKNHIVDIILRKKEGDYLGRYKTKSDICGWVLTDGDTPELASQNADKAWEYLKEYIIIE